MTKKQNVVPFGTLRRADSCPRNITRRVREPVSPSKGRVVGYYASWKNKRPIAWESQLELKACMLFEFSPAISAYQEQPATLHFPARGKMCRYTPDFELTTNQGDIYFVEVKPADRVLNPAIKSLLIAASDFLQERGFGYFVLTEEELNYPDLLRNLTMLKPYLKVKLCGREVSELTAWVARQGTVDLEELAKAFGSTQKAFAYIAQGHATATLTSPLCLSTKITLNLENHHETCLFNGRFAPDFE